MAQQSGDLMKCVECGNVVSMMYVQNEGDIYCLPCWDAKVEEEEAEEKDE